MRYPEGENNYRLRKNRNLTMDCKKIQLLAGQTKHSDAGATIEKDYYIFYATDRATGTREIIQCGMGAARDFLKLPYHKGLPLFNPLHGEGGEGGADRNPGGGEWFESFVNSVWC